MARKTVGQANQVPAGMLELLLTWKNGNDTACHVATRGNLAQLGFALTYLKVTNPGMILNGAALAERQREEKYALVLEHFGVQKAVVGKYLTLTCLDGTARMLRLLLETVAAKVKQNKKGLAAWITPEVVQQMAEAASAGDKLETLKVVERRFGSFIKWEPCLRVAIKGRADMTCDYVCDVLLLCEHYTPKLQMFKDAYDSDNPPVLEVLLEAFGRKWTVAEMLAHAGKKERERSREALDAHLRTR